MILQYVYAVTLHTYQWTVKKTPKITFFWLLSLGPTTASEASPLKAYFLLVCRTRAPHVVPGVGKHEEKMQNHV